MKLKLCSYTHITSSKMTGICYRHLEFPTLIVDVLPEAYYALFCGALFLGSCLAFQGHKGQTNQLKRGMLSTGDSYSLRGRFSCVIVVDENMISRHRHLKYTYCIQCMPRLPYLWKYIAQIWQFENVDQFENIIYS